MEGNFLVGSRLDEGAMPIDPANAAARSDRMSAWTIPTYGQHVKSRCGISTKLVYTYG
jgi:hypothetical protein